jgi:hypothetical protein
LRSKLLLLSNLRKNQVQTYANLCLLAALGFYAFSDAKMVGKGAKVLAVVSVVAFVVTEGMAVIA